MCENKMPVGKESELEVALEHKLSFRDTLGEGEDIELDHRQWAETPATITVNLKEQNNFNWLRGF